MFAVDAPITGRSSSVAADGPRPTGSVQRYGAAMSAHSCTPSAHAPQMNSGPAAAPLLASIEMAPPTLPSGVRSGTTWTWEVSGERARCRLSGPRSPQAPLPSANERAGSSPSQGRMSSRCTSIETAQRCSTIHRHTLAGGT